MQIRRHFPALGRFSAHLAATIGFVVALGLAADPRANAAEFAFTKLFSVQTSGWNDPANGGNGDYVFIDAPATGTTAEGTVTVSGRAGTSATDPNGGGGGGGTDFASKPQVVIAMIDTGGNPYHVDFRDPTRLVHPSNYLTGFPATAKAAPLCFVDGAGTVASPFTYNDNCQASFMANVAADASTVAVGDLVWYPGTRLMSKSFAHTDVGTPPGIDSGGGNSLTSHGSWVSSAAVGEKFGNCPECMLVILEGDTVAAIDAAYLWAAQQPWIDVITSSTSIGLIGLGSNPGLFPGFHDAAVTATNNGKIFLNAAGNGVANAGLAPTSTFLLGSSTPAAIPVGASTAAGFTSHWSDFPAEIMANGNQRGVADTASMRGETAVGGTSFSSPGAAGVLARSLLEARRTCSDFTEGVSGPAKTLLRNINATNGCAVTAGPATNGVLTRDELHEAFVKNAVPRYDQLTTIPGPIGWAKNAYGYVDLGNGVKNGGMTIQPAVTKSILGTQAIPVRALEQFWYDGVVREGQSFIWGPRPTADGDGDAFPRDDGACMPACAPAELQRYAEGFAGLSSSSTYQDLFDILGVSAQQFAEHGSSGLGVLRRPTTSVAGVVAETGTITLSNDSNALTVRLALAGALDGLVPTINSTPISYEVLFSANHNGVVQEYRASYEFEAVDLLGLLDGVVGDPLQDKFEVFADTLPDPNTQVSSICPITTDLSDSHYDVDTGEAVWVIPLSAFTQSNRPVGQNCTFSNGGRALQGGDKLTGITGSSVLTVALINFGNGLGLFGESEADDFTLSGGTQTDTDGDGVPDTLDQCANTPAGTDVDAAGCPPSVTVTINGSMGLVAPLIDGAWSLDIDFSSRSPVDGVYVVEASFGTATDTITLQASDVNAPLDAALSADKTSGAVPLTVAFDASGTTGGAGGLRYTFFYGNGQQSAAQDSPAISYTYGGGGSFQAYVIVTDSAGNFSESERILITPTTGVVVEEPPVETTADLRVSGGAGALPLTVDFDASFSKAKTGQTLAGYRFDFGDGSPVQTGTSATARHVYTEAGVYTATLTVTDSAGGSASDTETITVTANQAATVAVLRIVGPNSGAAPLTVNFDGSDSVAKTGETIENYSLDPDGPGRNGMAVINSPDPTFTVIYSTPGNYQPTLTVTDSSNATAQAKAQVAVRPQAAVDAQSGSGKGGALPLLLLLPLLGAGIWRRRSAVLTG